MPRSKKPWNPHKYLVAAARKTWRWSPERREALKQAQIGPNSWRCYNCGQEVGKIAYKNKRGRTLKKIDGAVDHFTPVGKQPKEWLDYPAYYTKMFCPVENLHFFCTACHAAKTAKEQAEKKALKGWFK